jgi:hypothetical protein
MIAVNSNDALSSLTAPKPTCSARRWFHPMQRTANAVHPATTFEKAANLRSATAKAT